MWITKIPFESSLVNIGSAQVSSAMQDSNFGATFKKGNSGDALYILGDGNSVKYQFTDKIVLGDIFNVSFRFKRDLWENPYKGSPSLQTIATLIGPRESGMSRITFGFYSLDNLSFVVSMDDKSGKPCKLNTRKQAVTENWHSVRLAINSIEKNTTLYFDEKEVDFKRCIPSLKFDGINSIVLGTWHEMNQAYKGLIDDVIVADKAYWSD